MSPSTTPVSPLEALKAGFRRACVRRLVGDEDGAIDVLKNEIPKLVVGWAKTTDLEASEKKAKLKEMFDDESGRADELATAFDLFAGRFERRVATLVTSEIKKACSRIEKAAKSISSFETTNISNPVTPKRESQSKFQDADKPKENIEIIEQNAVPQDNSTGKDIVPGKDNKDVIEQEVEEQEELAQLDEPLGLGLKFDEIEAMIDEVLSM
jgi:alpha-glucosidase (family GH31 glycosyl hydrolase)